MPNVICETCGNMFSARPSRIANGRGRFCSRSCASQKRIKTFDDMRCLCCGDIFTPDRSGIKYCSRSCAAKMTYAKPRNGKTQQNKSVIKNVTISSFSLFKDPWATGQIKPDEYGRDNFREPDFVLGF